MLPVIPPKRFWSIFALLSANSNDDHGALLSWIKRNIIAAIAGALADAYNTDHHHIDDALRHALVRLDDDARTGQPWARNATAAGRTSALVAFFDSEERVLRVVNTGPGRAFLGRRRVGGGGYECMELVGRYVELERGARTRRVDVEELVDEGARRGALALDVDSVQTRSVQVRDGDFLVMGSENAWDGLEGSEAVQAVSACISEQDAPIPEGWLRTGFDVLWKDEEEDDFGLGWVGVVIPAVMRDFDEVFSRRSRGNPAGCVLRRIERQAESSGAPGHDDRAGEHPTSSSG